MLKKIIGWIIILLFLGGVVAAMALQAGLLITLGIVGAALLLAGILTWAVYLTVS